MQEIFGFRQRGIDPDTGKVIGDQVATGTLPRALEHLGAQGEGLSESMFDAG
jgi:hypothetical protein